MALRLRLQLASDSDEMIPAGGVQAQLGCKRHRKHKFYLLCQIQAHLQVRSWGICNYEKF